MVEVGLDLGDGKERRPFRVEDDGGDVVVEQYPLAIPVRAADQEYLEGAMPLHADRPAAGVPEQVFHLGAPLGVGCAAQTEAEGEQAGPVLAGPVRFVRKAFSPQILSAVLGVIIMYV